MSKKFHLTTGFFLGFAQILLSVLFIGAFFWTLHSFMPPSEKMDPKEALEIVKMLLAVLTGSVVTIVAFWFSRSRSETHKNQETIATEVPDEPECSCETEVNPDCAIHGIRGGV